MNKDATATVQRILRAGTFASVPPQIGMRYVTRGLSASLLCFPSYISYVSVRRGLTSDVKRTFAATYYPVFDTARFAERCVQLSYCWLHASPFSVHVLRETTGSLWHVYKCCGRKLLSHVVGDGYGDALIRATSIGLADREPAMTYESNLPIFDEIREENLAQIALAEGTELGDEFRLDNIEDARPESTSLHPKQTLVFGLIKKTGAATLIFIPHADAIRLAAIHDALATSETWGQFFDAIPRDELDVVYERLRDEETQLLPDRSAKFDSDLLGCGDGDYPDFVEQKMFDWLPAAVCREFGKMESSVLNGPLLVLDVRCTPEIIAALEHAGFECRLDEELVTRACGNWVD